MTPPNTSSTQDDPQSQSLPPSTESSSTTLETPPTDRPAAPPTDPRYLELVEGTMRAQNQRLADLERENSELRTRSSAPPAAPAQTPDELRNKFYENPHAAIREVIQQELKETIAPLLTFANEARAETQLDRLIAVVKVDPRVYQHWGPKLEAAIRGQLASVPSNQLNQQLVSSVTLAALGQKLVGLITEDSSPNPNPNPASGREPVAPAPPYMRPSAPAGPPAVNNAPNHRPLNEHELRVLREYNAGRALKDQMTEAQYLEWQGLPAREVTSYKGDRPAPAGGR